VLQNVALQMGLRLVSKGGKEVTHVQQFVQRCEGCGTICKSQSKVFCPACGHATLAKVTVGIRPDGAEQYGIRKRFTLRGTRCGPEAESSMYLEDRAVRGGSIFPRRDICWCAMRPPDLLQVLLAKAQRGQECTESYSFRGRVQ
jgi:hypothetical protein